MADFFKFEAARINRIEYLSLILFVQTITITVFFSAVLISLLNNLLAGLLFLSIPMWYFFISIYAILLGIKRLHDLNRSGWMIILMFIPIFNIAWGIYMLCAPGTKGKNRFGEQPQPATLSRKIMLFVCLLVILIDFGIWGIIAQSKNKLLYTKPFPWKTCTTENYTIKFPGDYKIIKKNTAEGLTVINRSYVNQVDKIALNIIEANYTKARYKNFFNDSLTASPKKTIKHVIAIKSDAQIIVTLDKSLHKYGLSGRELHAMSRLNNNTYYIKSIIYLDKPHHKYYMLRAYYSQYDLQDSNDEVAKQFLASFKLLSH